MPDGDIIPRRVVRLWKRPHRLMCSGADAGAVAECTHNSLLKSLRYKGGLPGAHELAGVVQRVAEGQVALPDALGELRDIERRNEGHLHTRLAARAVAGMLVEISQGESLVERPLRAVLERFGWELVRYQLLARFEPDLQGTRFTTYEERLVWERGQREALRPHIDAIAASLERDPTGKRLRLSRTQAPSQPTTATILGVNLIGGTPGI